MGGLSNQGQSMARSHLDEQGRHEPLPVHVNDRLVLSREPAREVHLQASHSQHALRESIRGHQTSSEVIRRSSEAITGAHRDAPLRVRFVIRGHQPSSEVIIGAHRDAPLRVRFVNSQARHRRRQLRVLGGGGRGGGGGGGRGSRVAHDGADRDGHQG